MFSHCQLWILTCNFLINQIVGIGFCTKNTIEDAVRKFFLKNKEMILAIIFSFIFIFSPGSGGISIRDVATIVYLCILALLYIFDRKKHIIPHCALTSHVMNNLKPRIPFYYRIASAPRPLDEREYFANAISERDYWDWTFYYASPFKENNVKMVEEIENMYFLKGVATSAFAIIPDCNLFTQDIVAFGYITMHSEKNDGKNFNYPWRIGAENIEYTSMIVYTPYEYKSHGCYVECERYDSDAEIKRKISLIDAKLSAEERAADSYYYIFKTSEDYAQRISGIEKNTFLQRTLSDLNKCSFDLSKRRWRFLSACFDKKSLFYLVALVGYLLSPFTFWNDAFINFPIAYFMAKILEKHVTMSFSWLNVFCYIITNIVGVVMLYVGMLKIFQRTNRPSIFRGLDLVTVAVYSLALFSLTNLLPKVLVLIPDQIKTSIADLWSVLVNLFYYVLP